MQIQHGNKYYTIELRLIPGNSRYGQCTFYTKSEFDEMMSLEYPKVDVSNFNKYYNDLINKIAEHISSGKEYNIEWENVYLFIGITNNTLIFGRHEPTVLHRLSELAEKESPLLNGLLFKIDCYGWTVHKSEGGSVKVSYYTKTNKENPQVYPIYVYKDFLILGNYDETKPSVLKGINYFLYNDGEKIS